MNSIRKAIAAALVAGGGSLAQAADDGGVSLNEGWLVLAAVVVAFGTTWGVSNAT